MLAKYEQIPKQVLLEDLEHRVKEKSIPSKTSYNSCSLNYGSLNATRYTQPKMESTAPQTMTSFQKLIRVTKQVMAKLENGIIEPVKRLKQ